MEESILTSIKKHVGITKEYDHFDDDVMTYINSTFFRLRQIGVGPSEGFYIKDDSLTWDNFISDDPVLCNAVKTYMTAKVKLKFDPPASQSHIQVLKDTIAEFEWCMNIDAESL